MGIARRATADNNDENGTADTTEQFAPEDENAEPTRSSSVSRRGWGAAKRAKDKASTFEPEFKLSEDAAVVKFVEDEPFFSGNIHWVDEITEGQRSFICLDDDCPLCGVGYKRSATSYFNVVPITADGAAVNPEMSVLKAGAKLADLIKAENEDRQGPLSRHFWKMSKSGGGRGKGAPNYTLSSVKARDLAEDWEMDPDEVSEKVGKLKLFNESIVRYPTRARLEEVVEEYLTD